MKEFQGDLSNLPPNVFVSKESKEPEFEDFFLTLGLIFNDLKGLLFFRDSLVENFRRPPSGERSFHSGEYAALDLQLYRLIVGLTREFLVFLAKNQSVIKSPKFLLFLKHMNQEWRNAWLDMETIAFDRKSNTITSEFARTLEKIRHNITYHYWDSGHNLRKGFTQHFLRDSDEEIKEKAFYAAGTKMQNSRFFYADASAQEYLIEVTSGSLGRNMQEVFDIVDKMNHTIMYLLREYIQYRTRHSKT